MLCITAASFPPDLANFVEYLGASAQFPVSEEVIKLAQEICARPIIHTRDGIVQASSWIYAVMEAWRSKLCDYHVPGEASAMTGAKLAALVCKHMRAVFRVRRRALKDNVEYSERKLDPPPMQMGLVVGVLQRMTIKINVSMVLSEIQHP